MFYKKRDPTKEPLWSRVLFVWSVTSLAAVALTALMGVVAGDTVESRCQLDHSRDGVARGKCLKRIADKRKELAIRLAVKSICRGSALPKHCWKIVEKSLRGHCANQKCDKKHRCAFKAYKLYVKRNFSIQPPRTTFIVL